MSVRFVTVRLNFANEQHRRAWEVLQQMRADENASYSDTITKALTLYSEIKDSGNAGIEKAGERIAGSVEKILRLTLPSFLSGVLLQGNMAPPTMPISEPGSENVSGEPESDTIPDEEIPWDYLGE